MNSYFNKAEDYAKFRPEYHQDAVKILIEKTNLDTSWCAADIGSGTGNLFKNYISFVKTVYAVEPNKDMRKHAESVFNSHSAFVSIDGTSGNTRIPSKSIDLLTMGQALHWFNVDESRKEFKRIMKPNCWIAIIWNEFTKSSNINCSEFFPESEFQLYSFSHFIIENWEQYIGGIRSDSSSPTQDDASYLSFEEKHMQIFKSKAVDDLLKVEYTTNLILGRQS